jgi:hypothetical protein
MVKEIILQPQQMTFKEINKEDYELSDQKDDSN